MSDKFNDRLNELTGEALMMLGAGHPMKDIVNKAFHAGMFWIKNKEYETVAEKEETK